MPAKEIYWRMLLALKQELTKAKEPIQFCGVNEQSSVLINTFFSNNDAATFKLLIQLAPSSILPENASLVFQKTGSFEFQLQYVAPNISEECVQFFKHYLPYCFMTFWAKAKKRAITVAHFAQSLDGKIATDSGHSKWIGNTENLVHAHRMRALCDGILVGSGTLNADHPQLTVRHVEGENPTRIVLGTSARDYACLYDSCSKDILVIGAKSIPLNGQIQYIQLGTHGERINSHKILTYLYEQGIYSVYIEGGPTTTSGFLNDQAIDILQLHVAPIVLGAGISSIQLPGVEKVTDATTFRHFWFQAVGDAMMFTGIF